MSATICELGQIIRLSKRGEGVKIFAWLMSLLWQICGLAVAVVARAFRNGVAAGFGLGCLLGIELGIACFTLLAYVLEDFYIYIGRMDALISSYRSAIFANHFLVVGWRVILWRSTREPNDRRLVYL